MNAYLCFFIGLYGFKDDKVHGELLSYMFVQGSATGSFQGANPESPFKRLKKGPAEVALELEELGGKVTYS